jgi:hypothetical protein
VVRQSIIWNNVLPNAAAPELPPEQTAPPASWNELSFEVQHDAVEAWSDALLEAGALSVDARDADADSIDEVPLYGEPGLELPRSAGWQRTLLCVLLEAQRDPQTLLAEVADALDARIPITWEIRAIAQQDWVQLTQAQFEPIPIGKRLLIDLTQTSGHLIAHGANFRAEVVTKLTKFADKAICHGLKFLQQYAMLISAVSLRIVQSRHQQADLVRCSGLIILALPQELNGFIVKLIGADDSHAMAQITGQQGDQALHMLAAIPEPNAVKNRARYRSER